MIPTFRLFTFCLLLCTGFCPVLSAQPAGIVLYMKSGGEVFLLLADHTLQYTRGWGSFGGSHEDGETPAQTAARETAEETRGTFSPDALVTRLEGQEPVVDGSFHMYFLEIDFVPAPSVANNEPADDTVYFRERGPYAWIPFSEIRKHLVSEEPDPPYSIDKRYLPAGTERDWLWTVWIHNMRLAFQEGAIPWEATSPRRDDPNTRPNQSHSTG